MERSRVGGCGAVRFGVGGAFRLGQCESVFVESAELPDHVELFNLYFAESLRHLLACKTSS